jgi:hypothetical protein
MFCGVYVTVTDAGRLGLGDAITAPAGKTPEKEPEWA